MQNEIVFTTQTSDIIPATIKDLDLKYNDNLLRKLRLSITVDFRQYKQICKNEYFHLMNTSKLSEFKFVQDKPVMLELKPDAALFKGLVALEDRSAIETIILSDNDDGLSVRNEMNWYAAAVSQQIDIPEGLVEEGEAYEGFTTEFEEDDEDETADAASYLNELMDERRDIESVLQKYDIPFARDDDGFSGNVTLNDKKWGFFVYERERIFVVNSSYPFFAEKECYDALCREIVKINAELITGNFDLDMDEGIISFRTSFDAGEDYLSPDAFEKILIANMATTGKYYSQIKRIVK